MFHAIIDIMFTTPIIRENSTSCFIVDQSSRMINFLCFNTRIIFKKKKLIYVLHVQYFSNIHFVFLKMSLKLHIKTLLTTKTIRWLVLERAVCAWPTVVFYYSPNSSVKNCATASWEKGKMYDYLTNSLYLYIKYAKLFEKKSKCKLLII